MTQKPIIKSNPFPNAIPLRAYGLMTLDSLIEFRKKLVKVVLPVIAMLGISSAFLNNPMIIYSIAVLIILMSSVLYIRNYQRTITESKIKVNRGIFNLVVESISIDSIERCEVSQSFVSRLFGLSTAYIYSPGSETPAVTLNYLNRKQVEYVTNRYGNTYDDTVFEYRSTPIITLKAIFLPPFISLFPQAIVVLTLVVALFSSGDFASQLSTRADILGSLNSEHLLGEGGRHDQLLGAITSVKTLFISFILFYLATVIARLAFLTPVLSNVVLSINNSELTIKKGFFSKTTATVPVHRIVKIRYSDCWYSHLTKGVRISIDTISTSESQTSIPYMPRRKANDLLNHLNYPAISTSKKKGSDLLAVFPYALYKSKYTTFFATIFGVLTYLSSNPSHINLLMVITALFSLPLVANFICAKNSALIHTEKGFVAMRDYSIQKNVSLFPECAIANTHNITTHLSLLNVNLHTIIIGGERNILPTVHTPLYLGNAIKK